MGYIEQLASEYSLVMFEKVGFAKGDYPGYNQKKGDGRKCNRSFPLRNGCTFKFRMERKESEDESAMYCLVAAMAKMSMARAHDDVTMRYLYYLERRDRREASVPGGRSEKPSVRDKPHDGLGKGRFSPNYKL
uniref:Uncharacterized protein n=1 Tax=Aegilops tauschii TaxID=37682 RepID=M8C5D3_AEGTA